MLVVYSIFMQVSSKYFELRAADFSQAVKEISNDTPISQLTLDEIDKIRSKKLEISRKGDIPNWLNKWILYSFLGYIFSAMVAVLYSIFSSIFYDVFLILSFIVSTLIFTGVGSALIKVMVNILSINYDEYKLKEVETEKIVASKETEVLQELGISPELPENMTEIAAFNFEEENVGKLPKNWKLGANMSGTIEVSDDFGAEGTSQSLKIHNPENSRDIIRTSFEPLDKFTLIFSLRQEIYGDKRGVGTGFSIMHGTIQAIWFMITGKKLMGYWEKEYHEFCNIVEKRWYKIRLDVDCEKQEYYCYIDGTLIRRGLFRNKVNYIDTLQSAGWHKQAERLGYLDEIKILKPRE